MGSRAVRFCYFIPHRTAEGKELSVVQRDDMPNSKEDCLRQYLQVTEVKDYISFSGIFKRD